MLQVVVFDFHAIDFWPGFHLVEPYSITEVLSEHAA
jgi:hypothetical protein